MNLTLPTRNLLPWLLAFMMTGAAPCVASSVSLHSGEPLPVVSGSVLSSAQSHTGDKFFAYTQQEFCIENRCTPEGTVFSGNIVAVKDAHRFYRPGYLTVQLHAMQFPGQPIVTLDSAQAHASTTKIRDKYAETMSKALLGSIPGEIPGLILPVALVKLTTLTNRGVFLVTNGLGMTVDIAEQFIHPTFRESPWYAKVGTGVLSSFFIPDIIAAVRKQPNVNIATGDPIELKMPKDLAKSVFVYQPTPEKPAMLDDMLKNAYNHPEEDLPLPDTVSADTPPTDAMPR